MSFEKASVALHDSIRVDARVATTDQPFSPLNAFFYEDDPGTADRMPFDHEHIPFVGSNSEYVTSARFVPRKCGLQEVHVVVAAAGGAPVSDFAMIDVTANPFAELGRIAAAVRRLDLPYAQERRLLGKLERARQNLAPVAEFARIAAAIKRLDLPSVQERRLLGKLERARHNLVRTSRGKAIRDLIRFSDEARRQIGWELPASSANALIAQVDRLMGCL